LTHGVKFIGDATTCLNLPHTLEQELEKLVVAVNTPVFAVVILACIT